MRSSSIYGVNQLSLRSISSGLPLYDLRCIISVQFWGIVTSLMNGTGKIHHQTLHETEVRHDQLLGLELEILILHEMVADQDRSLHVSGVPTWLVHLCGLKIFDPIHKLDSPMCGEF